MFEKVSAPVQEVFRLSWRSPVVGCFALFFLLLGALAWPHVNLMLVLAAQFVVALFFLLLLSVVSITEEGIVLYRVNRLQWSQVKAARRVSLLGLPYLLISRSSGFRWWLPLYFSGSRSIEVALAERAPSGNPLRSHAASTNT